MHTLGYVSVAGSLTLLGSYMFLAEPFSICVKEFEFFYSNLPESFDGYKILHFSDLHINKMGVLEKNLMELVSREEVDSCFITGDVTANPRASDIFRRVCSAIRYKDRLCFVLGNSEHKPWLDSEMLAKALTFDGIDLLLNSNIEIARGSEKIYVTGVDDPYSNLHNMDEAFSGLNASDFIVFLTHCPSITPEAIEYGADLILAGHTHGGQVRLPGFGPIWTHMKKNKKLNDGLYESDRLSKITGFDSGESRLFVSRGVGTSKLHIRFACKPDIAFITLRCK